MPSSQTFDFTQLSGLAAYLNNDAYTVKSLTGGMANYVYQVTNVSNGETTVYKHAAAYLSGISGFALDARRMDFEASILKKMGELEDASSPTHAARVIDYQKDLKLLHMQYGGPRTLKAAYDDPDLNISAIGTYLARWVAGLHVGSKDMSLALDEAGKEEEKGMGKANNDIAVQTYRYSYSNLHSALAKFGHDTGLAQRIDAEFGSLLATDDECVCHGDFWPGNVLVNTNKNTPLELTVVDWEISRRGTSATDVGQFAAESFLLDRFRGSRALLPTFLDAYAAQRSGLGRGWVRRMVVHWAVHVAFWPTVVEWADEEGTGELVRIGVRVLEMVERGDWEGVRGCEVFEGVGKEWDGAFEKE